MLGAGAGDAPGKHFTRIGAEGFYDLLLLVVHQVDVLGAQAADFAARREAAAAAGA